MHELTLAESVVQLAEEALRGEPGSRVRLVRLEIGRLACVEPEALRFCFAAAAQGSIAEGARLDIVETPGQGVCARCGQAVEIAELPGVCPACGSGRLRVTGGDRMRVTELEVE